MSSNNRLEAHTFVLKSNAWLFKLKDCLNGGKYIIYMYVTCNKNIIFEGAISFPIVGNKNLCVMLEKVDSYRTREGTWCEYIIQI